MYRYFNSNPEHNSANDCVVRMLCKIFKMDWSTAYDLLWEEGRRVYEIPTTNWVWEGILSDAGFRKDILHCTNRCPSVYEFARSHRAGTYILCTSTHVLTLVDGDYYDAWDSGDERISYYFR